MLAPAPMSLPAMTSRAPATSRPAKARTDHVHALARRELPEKQDERRVPTPGPRERRSRSGTWNSSRSMGFADHAKPPCRRRRASSSCRRSASDTASTRRADPARGGPPPDRTARLARERRSMSRRRAVRREHIGHARPLERVRGNDARKVATRVQVRDIERPRVPSQEGRQAQRHEQLVVIRETVRHVGEHVDAQAIGSERGPGTQARPLTAGLFEAALGAGVSGADGHRVTQPRLRACQRADHSRDAPVRPRIVVVGRDVQDSQRTIACPAGLGGRPAGPPRQCRVPRTAVAAVHATPRVH